MPRIPGERLYTMPIPARSAPPFDYPEPFRDHRRRLPALPDGHISGDARGHMTLTYGENMSSIAIDPQDNMAWTHAPTGTPCFVRPIGEGWRGHVAVPRSHPLWGAPWDWTPRELDLTYPSGVIEGDGPDWWWLGFSVELRHQDCRVIERCEDLAVKLARMQQIPDDDDRREHLYRECYEALGVGNQRSLMMAALTAQAVAEQAARYNMPREAMETIEEFRRRVARAMARRIMDDNERMARRDEVADRLNRMVEDGTYPGLQDTRSIHDEDRQRRGMVVAPPPSVAHGGMALVWAQQWNRRIESLVSDESDDVA